MLHGLCRDSQRCVFGRHCKILAAAQHIAHDGVYRFQRWVRHEVAVSRWLKSANNSIPFKILTTASALCGTISLRTSITGDVIKNFRNTSIVPVVVIGRLRSGSGLPSVNAARRSPIRSWVQNSILALSPKRNCRRWFCVLRRWATPVLSVY